MSRPVAPRGFQGDRYTTIGTGSVHVVLDALGGRIASLALDGRELLAADLGDRLLAGCYPMVPWAGRLAFGRLTHEGRTIELPATMGPHAIHGLATDLRWQPMAVDHLSVSLAERWPLGGQADVRVSVADDHVELALSLTATEHSLPLSLGWHPCFNRRIDGAESDLSFTADRMIVRDDTGIPTKQTTATWSHPVDDCFLGVHEPPVVRWGDLAVELAAPTETWVVFDERDDVICVEPQTAPPDAPNQGSAKVLEPGETLTLPFTLRWGAP